jgi:hypothetical protein
VSHRGEDNCSSFDYDEFGTVEQCFEDRLTIKPQRPGLPLDVVLFDKHGTFIGPVAAISDSFTDPRYVVHVDGDLVFTSKCIRVKTGDSVYYYNCDRLSAETDVLLDELTLVEKKRVMRDQKKRGKARINNQIMERVIDNLRDMRIDDKQREEDEHMEEEQKSTSKNTKSIASIVLKSYCNRKAIRDRLEKQKARRYRKSKARILGDLSELREEKQQSKVRGGEQIEDEIELGKRNRPSKQLGLDSLKNQSTDYSKNSWETDRNNSSSVDKNPFLANLNMQIPEDNISSNPFLYQLSCDGHQLKHLFSAPPPNHK